MKKRGPVEGNTLFLCPQPDKAAMVIACSNMLLTIGLSIVGGNKVIIYEGRENSLLTIYAHPNFQNIHKYKQMCDIQFKQKFFLSVIYTDNTYYINSFRPLPTTSWSFPLEM